MTKSSSKFTVILRLQNNEFTHTPNFPNVSARLSISSAEPLRIGIVSGYFYYHAVWKIPIKGWIGNLNKERFSLYGYYTGQKKDKETECARKCWQAGSVLGNVFSFEANCNIIRKDNLQHSYLSGNWHGSVCIKTRNSQAGPGPVYNMGTPRNFGYFLP